MGRINKDDFTFHIEEIIGNLKEGEKHDWAKSVLRISWNEKPATVDIRSFNFSQNKPGKGISLSDEEVEELVDLLVEKDYGSMDKLKEALVRKMSRLDLGSEAENAFRKEPDYFKIKVNI